MAVDFATAREPLGKALDAVMLPDDIDEGIADALYELTLAFNGSDSSNTRTALSLMSTGATGLRGHF